jgi:hypothetical protein
VNYPYKSFPLNRVDPATKLDFAWRPALKVIIWYNHKRSPLLESILDTGADHCIFDAEIAEYLGIAVTKGQEVHFTGINKGQTAGFLHTVRVTIAGHNYDAQFVFAYGISATGILGQTGFFDRFVATFDWTPYPPQFDLRVIPHN